MSQVSILHVFANEIIDIIRKIWIFFQIEDELKTICEEVIDVLKTDLFPAATSGESKVFYHKM